MGYKVSIITPAYNSEKYIETTIMSAISQTYQDWEMLIVDDCSSDSTTDIVNRYAKKDNRIKLFVQDKNSGAGAARNRALNESTGRFIAYLDADDVWKKDKLERQVEFMINKNIGFSCTSYEVIEEDGTSLNKYIYMLDSVDYKGFLKNNLLQTVGIMVDTAIVDKSRMVMPDMRRRQDAATWLQILKTGQKCYGMKEILAEYRRVNGSLSSNKFKAAKGVWTLYRDVEKLPLLFSCYCYVRYVFLAFWKRWYI